MWRAVRRFLWCAALLAGLGALRPAVAHAGPDMSDYNTYWQVAEDPTPPSPNLDYNTYWAEVQAKQQ